LGALSHLYYLAQDWDSCSKLKRQQKLPRPVISVGNLTVGGTGKTPFTLALAQRFLQQGVHPCILTRGYGSRSGESRKVPPLNISLDWQEFGDEPLLLRTNLPTVPIYVGRDRWQSGQLALDNQEQADVFILDDGFQHRSLYRDVDLVLVDGERGFGNSRLLPAGPLREPLSALSRADRIGRVIRTLEPALAPLPAQPDFEIRLGPTSWAVVNSTETGSLTTLPKEKPVRVLSGIAAPKSFLKTVRQCGLEICSTSFYNDHHPFTCSELEKERLAVRQEGSRLVTTEKDAIRLRTLTSDWTEAELPVIIKLGLEYEVGFDSLMLFINERVGLEPKAISLG
jgi:tetraacyldisaccharide 4'-kinase